MRSIMIVNFQLGHASTEDKFLVRLSEELAGNSVRN